MMAAATTLRKMGGYHRGILVALAATLFVLAAVNIDASDAAAMDFGNGADVPENDMEEYLARLENYIAHRAKRARFCIRRDMTCPKLKNGNDFCCDGSQCSCNLFGQNCKCSPLGLFQRLG